MPTCAHQWCRSPFEVLPEDRAMLRKFDIDADPDRCPNCRHQHRAMFSPKLSFYRSRSALSGEPIITVYNPAKPYKVYSVKEWWGDGWDPLTYGRPFDASQTFFEQFGELYAQVPKMANQNENCENCEFSFACGNAKNVYYSRTVYRSEDVYYSWFVTGYNRMICDCLRCYRSSELYECVLCQECHTGSYLFRCSGSRDSHFCIDCRGCSDCLFCCNLRNKSFYVFNEPVSKEKFQQLKEQFIDGRSSTLQSNLTRYSDMYTKTIFPNVYFDNCENCTGDALTNCSNCFECYFCHNCEDCRYCWTLSPSEKQTSSMDLTMGGIGELVYNCTQPGGENYFLRMCVVCRKSHNLTYCIDCFSCRDCFGCTGLKAKQYCILNKQYNREEYEKLVPRIIEHMRRTPYQSPGGDGTGQVSGPAMKSGSETPCTSWGEFFPIHMSPFSYNGSIAMFYFPLARSEIERRGWMWADPPEHHEVVGMVDAHTMSDRIDDTSDDVCEKVWRCNESGRPFTIISQELSFYHLLRLPLPRHHPDLRMERRRSMLNPHRLWTRPCAKCGREMKTSYQPERPEIVYCEQCYLKEVY